MKRAVRVKVECPTCYPPGSEPLCETCGGRGKVPKPSVSELLDALSRVDQAAEGAGAFSLLEYATLTALVSASERPRRICVSCPRCNAEITELAP